MRNWFCIFTFLTCGLCTEVNGQNNRLSTENAIGWYNAFGTFKLAPKWSVHTEYQWRRSEWLVKPMQGLLRVGINHHVNPRVLLRAGYAWIETAPYGEIPLNGLGRDFTEHRTYQMLQLSHKESKLDIAHRFMLEQRFVGRYSKPEVMQEDEFPMLHRMRYMVRLQLPLKGAEVKNQTPYLAAYNEAFIGFGKQVNANIFDQNRAALLIGYRFSDSFRLEAGYLNQILQYGRQLSGKNIFQYNNGIIVNANFQVDLTK